MTTTLADELRAAVTRDGRSLPQIASAGGIDRVQLWRFMQSRRSLKIETADALIAALGLEIRLTATRGRKTRGGGK